MRVPRLAKVRTSPGRRPSRLRGTSVPHSPDVAEQDRIDSLNLYKALTEEVIPCFYNRDASGLPRQWLKRIRSALSTLAPKYTTWRMVQEYVAKYYLTRS